MNRGFARNCTAQQEEDDEIECEGEAFAAVQCKRRHCFCVDMETGLQLSGSRRFQRDEEFNCTEGTYESEIKKFIQRFTHFLFSESQCPVCDTVCLSGYEQGRDNCDTCKCKRKPLHLIVKAKTCPPPSFPQAIHQDRGAAPSQLWCWREAAPVTVLLCRGPGAAPCAMTTPVLLFREP